MHAPIRVLRAELDDLPGGHPVLSPRENDRLDRIVSAGSLLIGRHGRDGITIRSIAAACRLPAAIALRHFADMDELLGEIFARHLRSLSRSLERAAGDTPDCPARRRAIYVSVTRTGFGAFTPIHDLFMRHRAALPADIADPLERFRRSLGALLGGNDGDAALSLLDSISLDLPQIEALLERLRLPIAPSPAANPARANSPGPSRQAAPKPDVPDPAIIDRLFRSLSDHLADEAPFQASTWKPRPETGVTTPAPSRRVEALCSTAQARDGPPP